MSIPCLLDYHGFNVYLFGPLGLKSFKNSCFNDIVFAGIVKVRVNELVLKYLQQNLVP